MRMSKLFVQTLREFPNDAEAISHKLLVRAGYIKKLTSGIYSYLPLMQRVLAKISQIIREEMNSAGAQELLMPFVQPSEVWQKSGRWEVYGKELARFSDRHGNQMCLAPTHEEVITSVVSGTFTSYKQLPINLYQIQTKFRDEIRPRFGLLRGREFIMKDAYSFHTSQESLDKEYQNMAAAYKRIFERCGLETKMVQSDSGAIGGNVSHEFMVLTSTQTGENDVFYCENCDYSANSNHAVSNLLKVQTDGAKYGYDKEQKLDTPNVKTIDELAKFLNITPDCILKSVLYIADSKPVLVMIRGDKEVEETKLLNAVNAIEIRPATSDEAYEYLGCEVGYLSFLNVDKNKVKIIFDKSAQGMKNFVIGANEPHKHIVGYNFAQTPDFVDVSLVKEGELCPYCNKPLKVTRGIEVGNIFQLGTKYSKPMNATYTDENGEDKPFIMGCYGIGVTRTAAAAIERYHDDFGIVWPKEIAPYHVDVVPVNTEDEEQMQVALEIYNKLLNMGVEVVIDDRADRAGVKFKDSELIGFPYRITVGKTIKEGLVEFKCRKTGNVEKLTMDEAVEKCKTLLLS
ncbi:TPA: proline--tRNA ligase [Candidatus Galligastranaerophilus intestinavium]|uniref:Proline--tRNA ligase n=1 Tax=Candidatus Galligastranaerophilus intestinavium TaxID=2840836 RepID=A0A9D1FIV6_9BACT|nr:proline--tRNA ligase [Candidatus Galligastranaerophilus intestinavium]